MSSAVTVIGVLLLNPIVYYLILSKTDEVCFCFWSSKYSVHYDDDDDDDDDDLVFTGNIPFNNI